MTPDVHVQVDGPILIVTLDRPKANAINAATSKALHDAVSLLRTDDSLRVGIVTAAGDRFFSAGWDLKSAHDGEAHDADHGPGGFAGITELFDVGKPIIAAVSGSAYGGGVELMLAADLIVAAETAVFAFPEAKLGILPDAGGVIRLPAIVPRPLAVELLLTGRTFTATEAMTWGMINHVVPTGQVLQVAKELAAAICAAAPLAVSAILDIINRTAALDTRTAFNVSRQLPAVVRVSGSGDSVEGAKAYAEQRSPRWQGR